MSTMLSEEKMTNVELVKASEGLLNVLDDFIARVDLSDEIVDALIEEVRDRSMTHNSEELGKGEDEAKITIKRKKKKCFFCWKNSEEAKLHRCSGCMKVRYCSTRCQKDDWERHRDVCRQEKNKETASEKKS